MKSALCLLNKAAALEELVGTYHNGPVDGSDIWTRVLNHIVEKVG